VDDKKRKKKKKEARSLSVENRGGGGARSFRRRKGEKEIFSAYSVLEEEREENAFFVFVSLRKRQVERKEKSSALVQLWVRTGKKKKKDLTLHFSTVEGNEGRERGGSHVPTLRRGRSICILPPS